MTELWTHHNPQIIQDVIEPTHVLRMGAQTLEGRKTIRRLYDTYHRAFPELTLQIGNLVSEGPQVALMYTMEGTHSGPLRDIKPTERRVQWIGLSILRLENEMITETTTLWDELHLMEQLGVISETETEAARVPM